ncbi:hypothetical protein [Streptomyces sp. NRRL F-5126]|uniref:hypothetical protein n=1 Tax=Streptomyces sp. NRRL F-5126 TaxID=1463857 RepID=UPI0004CC5106|nr:hypothetical protein [Streptomyces sp. NRRL F-5126]
MDVVSWVSAGVALASATATAVLGYWQQQRLRTMEQRDVMDSYGASLAWAAFDFQGRLFNILHGYAIDSASNGRAAGYLTSFLVLGSEREAEYARRSTVFVLAEYLGWVEMLRRDVQFLDLGSSSTNRSVMAQISNVGHALSRVTPDSNELRLFRAEQRAIGELMVHQDGEPKHRRCLGFAEFCARLDGDEAFRGWFERLLADVDALAADTGPAVGRLLEVQRQLVTLLDLLDPRSERFPHFRAVFDPERLVG